MAVSDSVRRRKDDGMTGERLSGYFGRDRPTLLAILLCRDERETLGEVERAIGGGADGVFLVADGIGHQKLLSIARAVLARHPKLFVGVRCLDLRPQDVFCRLPAGIRAVWTDAPLPGTNGKDSRETLAAIEQARRESGWTGLHFVTLAWPAAGGAGPPAQESAAPASVSGVESSAPAADRSTSAVRASLSAAGAADVIVLAGPNGLEPPAGDVASEMCKLVGDRAIATLVERPGPKCPERVLRIDWPAPTADVTAGRSQTDKLTEKLVS